jgi:TetR/AcrR family transcriptional regulator
MGIHERKEREKEHRREEILVAAQAVFFEKGLQNSTMDEIAERAELSKGTLYLYYKSKEDLYLAVMIQGMEVLHAMFEKSVEDHPNPIQAIQRLGDTYYQYFHEHRDYFRMMHFFQTPQLHRQVSEEMMHSCSLQNQKIWQLVVEIIERGMREGLFRTDLSASEMAIILWSASNAIILRMDYEQNEWTKMMNISLDEILRKTNRLLLEAMLRPGVQR